MVFCNIISLFKRYNKILVTILILIDGFLQFRYRFRSFRLQYVTILILIDGFLQYSDIKFIRFNEAGHNPYFNRWFSAIKIML